MNSVLKNLFRLGTKNQESSQTVHLSVFGKHPGWDDHIDDIGLETETLIAVKRLLYIEGIGGNIDSGSWDKINSQNPRIPFDHEFLWSWNQSIVAGKLWASSDGKGRTSYPMVVCAECTGVPLQWMMNQVFAQLESLYRACLETDRPDQVNASACQAQELLREQIQLARTIPPSPYSSRDILNRLAPLEEFGPNHTGLFRIAYYWEREIGRFLENQNNLKRTKTSPSEISPKLLRIPVQSLRMKEAAQLWFQFFHGMTNSAIPVLVLMPLKEFWIDVIVGIPTQSQLYCLCAPQERVPLTTSIPYDLDTEFITRISALIDNV